MLSNYFKSANAAAAAGTPFVVPQSQVTTFENYKKVQHCGTSSITSTQTHLLSC